MEEAIDALSKKLPGFLDHVYVKRKQSRFFEEKISNLKPNEAAVQVDFSENYTCALIKMKYRQLIGTSHRLLFSLSLFGQAMGVRAMLLCQMRETMTNSLSLLLWEKC